MSVMQVLHFLRWRLIALRYAGKLRSWNRPGVHPRSSSRTRIIERMALEGHAPGPRIAPAELEQARAIYTPRTEQVVQRQEGHPFTNLFRAEDISANNPVFRFALSPEVLDRADEYFGGNLRFDSIQVLYSWPTEGALRESQMWHKDYGDAKSFHCVAYVNDVMTPEDGPFVFVDRVDTRKVRRSPFIRRISDQDFARELGDGKLRHFYGRGGESVLVDPAVCYHYGSRCKQPRLAVFVTFNTHRPFVAPAQVLQENTERAVQAAQLVRPDLSESYLRRILS
jgi:hypothetical protein